MLVRRIVNSSQRASSQSVYVSDYLTEDMHITKTQFHQLKHKLGMWLKRLGTVKLQKQLDPEQAIRSGKPFYIYHRSLPENWFQDQESLVSNSRSQRSFLTNQPLGQKESFSFPVVLTKHVGRSLSVRSSVTCPTLSPSWWPRGCGTLIGWPGSHDLQRPWGRIPAEKGGAEP